MPSSTSSSSSSRRRATSLERAPAYAWGRTWAFAFLLASLFIGGMYVSLASVGAPAPKFSNSFSYNEKMVWLGRQDLEDCDVLAIGSSMTLNNLHTQVVRDRLSRKYLNAASWGLKMTTVEQFSEILLSRTAPTTVISVFGPNECSVSKRKPQLCPPWVAKAYLSIPHVPVGYALTATRPMELIGEWHMCAWRRGRDFQRSVDFDVGGGVSFTTNGFKRLPERWSRVSTIFGESPDDEAYAALQRFASRLMARGIRFVAAQAPVRLALIDAAGQARLDAHWARTRRIVEGAGGSFHELHSVLSLDDSAFADPTHLLGAGARAFTSALMDRVVGP